MGGSLVKHFHIIMAAFISGTVALFTSVLGVSGTIIGSVLSSFLYQLLSGYSEEKLEEGGLRKPKLANEIVYIFPLVVIGIFELIFVFSALHYKFDMLFDILESAVNNNLFRLMGISLILLGAYPFFDSNNIDKRNGLLILVIGVLLFLRGLVDISDMTLNVFYTFFAQFDMLFALFVVFAIVLVILNIFIGYEKAYSKSNEFVNQHMPKAHARKVETSLNDIDNNQLNENSEDSQYAENQHSDVAYQENPENLPVYDEEIILVNNPEDPENPIKKRILKRVKPDNDIANDSYEDVYIIEESE